MRFSGWLVLWIDHGEKPCVYACSVNNSDTPDKKVMLCRFLDKTGKLFARIRLNSLEMENFSLPKFCFKALPKPWVILLIPASKGIRI